MILKSGAGGRFYSIRPEHKKQYSNKGAERLRGKLKNNKKSKQFVRLKEVRIKSFFLLEALISPEVTL